MENPQRTVYMEIHKGNFYRQQLPGDHERDMVREQRGETMQDLTKVRGVSGKISSVSTWGRESKSGKKYDILLLNVEGIGDKRTIKLFLDSQPARDLVVRLYNIEPGEMVNIFAWQDDRGIDRISIQTPDGESIKSLHTKQEPDGMPQWYKTPDGWDRSALLQWMKKKVLNYDQSIKSHRPETAS